jgi:nucleotide-binding universal stress UspA family protein
VAEQKDYLGDKLRQVERAREDVYFRQLDQELVAQMRQQASETTEEENHLSDVFKTILVPVDFSPYSTKALNYAADMAAVCDASIIVLHVIDRPTSLSQIRQRFTEKSGATDDLTDAAQISDDILEAAVDEQREHAYADLQAFLPPRLASHPVDLRVVLGHPFERIIETAVRESAALIILGTHGRTGLSRAVMGSIAERVARLAPCPVMMVRAPSEEEESWLRGFYETFIPPSSSAGPDSTMI